MAHGLIFLFKEILWGCTVGRNFTILEGLKTHKAMRMKVMDLRPPPACTESYRQKISLLAKILIICTKKA
jgi:hypothetical protein